MFIFELSQIEQKQEMMKINEFEFVEIVIMKSILVEYENEKDKKLFYI